MGACSPGTDESDAALCPLTCQTNCRREKVRSKLAKQTPEGGTRKQPPRQTDRQTDRQTEKTALHSNFTTREMELGEGGRELVGAGVQAQAGRQACGIQPEE
jgi:hypothetical protein